LPAFSYRKFAGGACVLTINFGEGVVSVYLRSSKKIDANRYEMEIEVGSQEFDSAVDKIYRREKEKINIPGFRKGKAPRAFIEKYYGENVFYEDALNSIYPDVLDAAATEAGIELVDDHIDFELVKASRSDGAHFKVKVTAEPDVEIEDYKGIKVAERKIYFTDEDMADELKRVQKRNGRLVIVKDRAAKLGDTVTIDFVGHVDGEEFEGSSAENFNLELGQNHFVGNFEEQVAGHSAGDKFDVKVTFPENYTAKKVSGKEAVFNVKLHEIKELELPEIDDEFVKDVSEFDNLDDYKKDLEEKVKQRKKKTAEDNTENELVDKLISRVKATVPEAMIKAKLKELVRDFEYRLQSQGLKLDDYIKYSGMTLESIEEQFRPQAESHVKLYLGLKKIVKLENIVPTEDEIADEYGKITEQYKLPLEKIKNIVPLADVKKDICSRKALDIVKKSSIVEAAK
jgi:trigger factor